VALLYRALNEPRSYAHIVNWVNVELYHIDPHLSQDAEARACRVFRVNLASDLRSISLQKKKPLKAKWLDKHFVRVKGSNCLWYDKHERFKVVAIEERKRDEQTKLRLLHKLKMVDEKNNSYTRLETARLRKQGSLEHVRMLQNASAPAPPSLRLDLLSSSLDDVSEESSSLERVDSASPSVSPSPSHEELVPSPSDQPVEPSVGRRILLRARRKKTRSVSLTPHERDKALAHHSRDKKKRFSLFNVPRFAGGIAPFRDSNAPLSAEHPSPMSQPSPGTSPSQPSQLTNARLSGKKVISPSPSPTSSPASSPLLQGATSPSTSESHSPKPLLLSKVTNSRRARSTLHATVGHSCGSVTHRAVRPSLIAVQLAMTNPQLSDGAAEQEDAVNLQDARLWRFSLDHFPVDFARLDNQRKYHAKHALLRYPLIQSGVTGFSVPETPSNRWSLLEKGEESSRTSVLNSKDAYTSWLAASYWYRRYFIGHDHLNLVGTHSELGPVVISLVEESREKDQVVMLKAIYRTQFSDETHSIPKNWLQRAGDDEADETMRILEWISPKLALEHEKIKRFEIPRTIVGRSPPTDLIRDPSIEQIKAPTIKIQAESPKPRSHVSRMGSPKVQGASRSPVSRRLVSRTDDAAIEPPRTPLSQSATVRATHSLESVDILNQHKGLSHASGLAVQKQPVKRATTAAAPTVSKQDRRLTRLVNSLLDFDSTTQKTCLQRESSEIKVGVVFSTGHEDTEEQILSHVRGTTGWSHFLNHLGQKVKLAGWKGFSGGLDTKASRLADGPTSIFRKYAVGKKTYQLMYHVSTLLPYVPNDKQQVRRKRHIFNNSVVVVYRQANADRFLSTRQVFHPMIFRSRYTQIFIVVERDPLSSPLDVQYRVSTIRRQGIPPFGPQPLAYESTLSSRDLTAFLLEKIIEGEKAVRRSVQWRARTTRARQATLNSLCREFS